MEMASVLPILEAEGESAGDEQQHVSVDPFRKAMRVTTAAFVGLVVVMLGLAVAVGFARLPVRTEFHRSDGLMEEWEDFSEDSVNKIFQIQSTSQKDYLYADKEVNAGSSGIGNDFKVHIHNSKGQIMLQGFQGNYVYWEVKDGVLSLSLRAKGNGKFNGYIFYLQSGGPTFELLMGSSVVKLCRTKSWEKEDSLEVGTPAKPCYNKGAGKWTFKDVTSTYDEDGVTNFGNGKDNRIPCTVTTWTGKRCDGKQVETYRTTSVQEFKWNSGYQENDPNSARVTGVSCDKVEFYDEDRGRANYKDNEWMHGEGCLKFPWDLQEDLGGLQIWAK